LSKKANRRVQQKILSLWSGMGKEKEPVSYKQIVSSLKNDGVSERTVARYLLKLVEDGKLEKIERGYKKTFYRPYDKVWDNLVESKQQFQISEESLNRIGAYVMNTLSATITDAQKTTEQFQRRVWEDICSVPEYEQNSNANFDKAMDLVLHEKKPTEEERKELNKLIKSLVEDGLLPTLTCPPVFARLYTEEELPEIVQANIWELVKKFMNIWAFLYKHPWAVPEVEENLSKKIS
jgi:DNA-binding transcriptional ArsR family regulator